MRETIRPVGMAPVERTGDAHARAVSIARPRTASRARPRRAHGQALSREQRARKYLRLKSLSERAAHGANVFAALAARELEAKRKQDALRALRSRSSLAALDAALERRRLEFVGIPHDPTA